MGKAVIKWDGKHLPKELMKVPPGNYSLELVQDAAPPSKDEQRGILKALRELDAGEGRSLSEVIAKIRGRAVRARRSSLRPSRRRISRQPTTSSPRTTNAQPTVSSFKSAKSWLLSLPEGCGGAK